MKAIKLLSLPIAAIAFSNPIVLSAQQFNKDYFTSVNTSVNNKEEEKAKIIQLSDVISDALKYSYQLANPIRASQVTNVTGATSEDNLEMANYSIEQLGDPIIVDNPDVIFIGKTVLENSDDQEQTLTTQSFTQEVVDSTTKTITWGISKDIKAGINIEIFNVESTTTFSFNKSDSETHSTSVSMTAPPQTIKVPGHSKRYVKVLLNQLKMKINVKLNCNFKGTVNGTINFKDGSSTQWSTNIGYGAYCAKIMGAFKEYDNDQAISYNADKSEMIFNGLGKVLATNHGSIFNVKVSKTPDELTN